MPLASTVIFVGAGNHKGLPLRSGCPIFIIEFTLCNITMTKIANKQHAWQCTKISQLISRIATHLVFSSSETLIELSHYGLTPIDSFSATEESERDIETSIPILNGKTVQWQIANSEPITAIYLKLGTCGRINRCHLTLSIFKKQQERLVTVVKRKGASVKDNQWTEFLLDTPLLPNQYICQLQSPNADNNNNTLFLWLTVQDAFSIDTSTQELSDYGLTPILSFSPTQKTHRNIERTLPIKRGKILQWQLAKNNEPISAIYFKLGTGGRINQCHIELSIFKKQAYRLELVTLAKRQGTSVQDKQWTQFVLESPLLPGQYTCQLQSPDAGNNNTIYLYLTTENEQKQGIANYCYVSPHSQALFTQITLISLIMVVDKETPYLRHSLNSIVTQNYPHWELCIVAADNTVLKEYRHRFSNQIKLADKQTSNPYNTALEMVTGEYVALIEPVDLLTEDALLEIVKWTNQTSVDMLYSDEDKVNEGGLFDEPYFKPDWAAEMLKGQMYTGQLSVYRTHLLKQIGGFRGEIQALQIWDMVLRFTAQTQRIQHIPKILYHKRQQPPVSSTLRLKMVQAALDREAQGGRVTLNTSAPNTCLLHYPVQGQPLVSIIIPTKDMADTLAQNIEAIRTITTYPHWEIIIVDNGSTEAATFALFEKYQAELGTNFTVYRHDIPFNFSKLVNQGVKAAQGEIILLLNNDTQILGPPDWLQEMIGFAQHPQIACVGCKLLYPQDNTIQHAGVICGVAGIANHSHKHFPAESRGYFDRLAMVANYSAITGACLMIKRKLWDKGFDEKLPIAFNDVDFCLKLHTKGLRHVVLPQVIFYHHESKTRGLEDTAAKQARLSDSASYMEQRWGTLLQNDPFYNPHLSRESEDFRLSRESIYYASRPR
ncbi:MAG: glycosyltransferase family 2 protein [Pseudomonadota bacterium]